MIWTKRFWLTLLFSITRRKSRDVMNSAPIAALTQWLHCSFAVLLLCCSYALLLQYIYGYSHGFSIVKMLSQNVCCAYGRHHCVSTVQLPWRFSDGYPKPICKSHCGRSANDSEITTTALRCMRMRSESQAKALQQHCDKFIGVATFECWENF